MGSEGQHIQLRTLLTITHLETSHIPNEERENFLLDIFFYFLSKIRIHDDKSPFFWFREHWSHTQRHQFSEAKFEIVINLFLPRFFLSKIKKSNALKTIL